MSGHQRKPANIQGSLACGNPKRYSGRDVVRMSQGVSRGIKRSALDDDDSTKTQGELHLQRLLEKQINTDVTLAGQFSEHRTFSKATAHCPSVDKLVGIHGYQEYKSIRDLDSKIEVLRHYGLDEEEISLKLRQDTGAEVPPEPAGYGADPSIEARKLQEIERKIEEKERQLNQQHGTKGALLLTRQEMEVELSHRQRYEDKSQGEKSHKANAALLIQSKQIEPAASHPNDPINHIPDMIDDLNGRVKEEREPRRERRRRRKIERRMQYYQKFETESCEREASQGSISPIADSSVAVLPADEVKGSDVDTSIVCKPANKDSDELRLCEKEELDPGDSLLSRVPPSDADCDRLGVQQDRTFSCQNSDEDVGEATCAPRPPGWVSAKPVKKKKKPQPPPVQDVEMEADVIVKSREEIAASRLSFDEIIQLPKFQNYSAGDPNKVLYLKNLPSQTTVQDLMEVFGFLQKDCQPRITFKLLTGRMKGQAFVNFHDEDEATQALALVNGYILHGSPVIISYGKKT